AVARRLFESLSPGGWLITASSDPPLGARAPFETVTAEAGVFYRRPANRGLPIVERLPFPRPCVGMDSLQDLSTQDGGHGTAQWPHEPETHRVLAEQKPGFPEKPNVSFPTPTIVPDHSPLRVCEKMGTGSGHARE